MNPLFTARKKCNHTNFPNGSWEAYKQWSGIYQLDEIVSLDGILNEDIIQPNFDNKEDWNYVHVVDNRPTGFYTKLTYVLTKVSPKEKFNLLAVPIAPQFECSSISLEEYEFLGYDLLDEDFAISALTNCKGLNETFLPKELNNKVLLDKYDQAKKIQKNC